MLFPFWATPISTPEITFSHIISLYPKTRYNDIQAEMVLGEEINAGGKYAEIVGEQA